MKKKEFELRRMQLLDFINDKDSIIIIFGQTNEKTIIDNCFYYLTGLDELESIALFSFEKYIIFNKSKKHQNEIWDGPYIGQLNACHKFGANVAYSISNADELIPLIIKRYKNIYSNTIDNNFNSKIINWINNSNDNHFQLKSINLIINNMRMKKSNFELKLIKYATNITSNSHLRAMKKCSTNIFEYELEAEILHEFIINKSKPAFNTIVAGGRNACFLHYSKNTDILRNEELVIIDAGARYENYCSDISRTFPVNGKFNYKQSVIYEIVLSVYTEVLKKIKAGVTFQFLQSIAETIITHELRKAKFINFSLKNSLIKQRFKKFFMHRIGHLIGLEVHDNTNDLKPLEIGNILTIEPGFYFKNVGIRIEDMILVKKNGCEVLSNNLPLTRKEIENVMKKILYKI